MRVGDGHNPAREVGFRVPRPVGHGSIHVMSGTGQMTPDERELFLTDVHVGVLAVDEPGRGPLALPIWYLFRDGALVIEMDGTSRKAELLRAAGRATVTVQSETPPYKYVSVEGPVELTTPEHDALEMATRYLGPDLGARYVEHEPRTESSVAVVLTPEHWRTYDFAKDIG